MKQINLNKLFILSIVALGAVSSLPHLYTHNDLWDGTYFNFFMDVKDYETIKLLFNRFSADQFSYIYILIDFFRRVIQLDIQTALNISALLVIIISSFSIYLFLYHALRINITISFIISLTNLIYPLYTLLVSSTFIYFILAPIILILGLGIFYIDKHRSFTRKIIGWLFIFYSSIFPILFPFSITLILLIYVQQTKYEKIGMFSLNQNLSYLIISLSAVIAGVLFYVLAYNDITAGYKHYGTIKNIIFSVNMFVDYLEPYFLMFMLPLVYFMIHYFFDYKHAFILTLLLTILLFVSVFPYAFYNKQPLCLIDSNCKEYFYDFKERHTILLSYFMIVFSAISLNSLTQLNFKIYIILLIIYFIVTISSLFPTYYMNHNRNLIRDIFLNQISDEIVKFDSKYNYIQILVPNTKNIYRFKGRDFNLLAHKKKINYIIFDSHILDDRVPDKNHKDYWIVPNEPNFEKHMNNIRNKYNEGLNLNETLYREFSKPICGARYILTFDSNDENLVNYFNMREYKKNYLKIININKIDVKAILTLLDNETCSR